MRIPCPTPFYRKIMYAKGRLSYGSGKAMGFSFAEAMRELAVNFVLMQAAPNFTNVKFGHRFAESEPRVFAQRKPDFAFLLQNIIIYNNS